MLNPNIYMFGLLLIAVGLLIPQLAAHEALNVQDFAKMSDSELWATVMECTSREEMQLLLDDIPLAVMAKHAKTAMDDPKNEPSFGNMITQVVWPELSENDEPSRYYDRFLETCLWRDSTGKYEVEAQIFDVREEAVVLQKADDSQVNVPIERLSGSADLRLRTYIAARKLFVERLPDNRDQLPVLITGKMTAVLDRRSRLFLLNTLVGTESELEGQLVGWRPLRFDSTGSYLVMPPVWDIEKGEQVNSDYSSLGLDTSDTSIFKGPKLVLPFLKTEPITVLGRHAFSIDHIQSNFQIVFTWSSDSNSFGPSDKNTAELIDIVNDETVYQFKQHWGPFETGLPVGSVSRNGAMAAYAADTAQDSIELFDTRTKEARTIMGRPRAFWFSADGSRLVMSTGDKDSTVLQIWDTSNAKLIHEFKFPELSQFGFDAFMRLSPDGSRVAALLDSGGLILLDLESGNKESLDEEILSGVETPSTLGSEFSPSGERLILATEEDVRVWDVQRGKMIDKWERNNRSRVVATKVSPDGSKMVILAMTESPPDHFRRPGLPSTALDWPVVHERFLGVGNILELWDLESGRQLDSVPLEKDEWVSGFDISPDSKRLAVSSWRTKIVGRDEKALLSIKVWRLPK